MNKRHYEHTLPNIRGSLSNTYLYSEKVEIFNPVVVRHFRFVIFHFFRLNHNLSFLIKHDRLGKSQYFYFLYAPVCFLP